MSDLQKTHKRLAGADFEAGESVRLGRTAGALIDEGNALEEQGRFGEAMARYDAAVRTDPQCARAHLNRGNIFFASAQIQEARTAYDLAVAIDPHYPGAHFNLGNLNARVGDLQSALRSYRAAIDIKPDFADAFVAMGNVLDAQGQTSEAINSYEAALAINPTDAGVHLNLGVIATREGQLDQAADSLRRAIALRPDYAEAYHALGKVLRSLSYLDEAAVNFRRALVTSPESEEILCDLAMTLVACGHARDGFELMVRRLERPPTPPVKTTFAWCVAHTKTMIDDPRVREALTLAITEPWGEPPQLCRAALSLIMLNPRIARSVSFVDERWTAQVSKAALFDARTLTELTDPLLHALLEAAPVCSMAFEHFLTAARHAALELATEQPARPPATAELQFYAALARQCFINEYIFACDASERRVADACRQKLAELLETGACAPPLLLLAVAAYFPLHSLPKPHLLLAGTYPQAVEGVLRQQIREPLEERSLRANIERLTSIADDISTQVRDQYEENPYPRWTKRPMRNAPLYFNEELRRTFPLARFTPLNDDRQPELLIAGCGTGSHPISVSQRFRGAQVLAVDLSLSSLSYALRKTHELDIANITYAQADILELGSIARTFDVIESVGVLHHLAEPFSGWRRLLSRLRPGGFMHLGFYSQLARRHVFKARELIAARGYTSAPDEIRRFRQDLLAAGTADEVRWLTGVLDFYSTSECRDLIFHVQEHCLTLDQISAFISESGLHFIGFELDPIVRQQYRRRFPEDPAATELRNWKLFEADNPDTFAGMYQFWIQSRPDESARISR
jgi:Tfp pilus assembly protein PilF/2-polyprenyl-3-methyl-5-hydroxy-6-metoxy-1,4-benzoquinol methylase